MTIRDERPNTKSLFNTLLIGATFLYGGRTYIKTYEHSGKSVVDGFSDVDGLNAICLEDGSDHEFEDTDEVQVVNCELVIKDIVIM